MQGIRYIMALPQQKEREIVFQILYSQDIAKIEEEEIVPFIMKELLVTKKSVCQALQRCQLILSKKVELDAQIEQASISYEFSRIPLIEKNILRLAAYELLFDEKIPEKVAIAEAIRLSRKFSSPESGSFINAVLDVIFQKKAGGPKTFSEAPSQEEAFSQ